MKHLILPVLVLIAFSCNQQPQKPAQTAPAKQMAPRDTAKAGLGNLTFAVKKDLVCGMPVSAGISDTFRYKDKLYGFCSPECKEEFVKLPGQFIAATSK